MALMSAADKAKAARWLGNKLYVEGGATANLHHDDLVAAIDAIDGAMDGLPPALPNQAQSITLNLNTALPEPFKGTATTPQKSWAVIAWAGVKYGSI